MCGSERAVIQWGTIRESPAFRRGEPSIIELGWIDVLPYLTKRGKDLFPLA